MQTEDAKAATIPPVNTNHKALPPKLISYPLNFSQSVPNKHVIAICQSMTSGTSQGDFRKRIF